MKTTLGAALEVLVLSAAAASADWARWPEPARQAAREMVEEYGAPDRVFSDRLEWGPRGSWRSLTVHLAEDFPRRSGVLEQSVAFDVPPSRWGELAALGFGVSYDPAKRELTASAESQAINRLALNVAVDVVRERRTAMNARDFYRRTLDLQLSGKSSRYTRDLLFEPAPEPFPPIPPARFWRPPLRP